MVVIRPATLTDATTIVRIHLTSWQAQFKSFLTPEQVKLKDLDEANQLKIWQERLTDQESEIRHTFIAMLDDVPVGYITGVTTQPEIAHYDTELHQIYVLPDAHRLGYWEAIGFGTGKPTKPRRF